MADLAVLATADERRSPVTDDAKPRSHAVHDELFGTSPTVSSLLDHAPATMPHLPQQQFQGDPLPAQPVPDLLQGASPRGAGSFGSSGRGGSGQLAGHSGGSSSQLAVGSPARATSWGHHGNGNGTMGGDGDGSGSHAGGNGAGRRGSSGVLPQLPQSPLRTPRTPRREEAVVQPSEAQPVLPTQVQSGRALSVVSPVTRKHGRHGNLLLMHYRCMPACRGAADSVCS